TEVEKEIIDSFPVQRLHRLRQLAGAEFVYPGANHTRFEHSLGVMHLAGLLVENPNLSDYLSEHEVQLIRMAALLHDVGHGPFSHIFEHVLTKFLNKTHEDMTGWVIRKSELADVIHSLGYDPEVIAKLAVGSLQKAGKAFMDQVIRSSVDVDKLDFVVRDTYHTGAEYGFVDIFRLIHMLDVLDENLAVDLGALAALESFILARMESFKSIYFHRVSRAAQIMIARGMEHAKDELGLTDFKSPEEYLALNDYTLWGMLKECEKSTKIIENLEKRRLLKVAYDQTFHVRDKTISGIFGNEEIRNQIRDQIASKAGVESPSVVIDVPTLPSVPYRHSVLLEPMEIPVFEKRRDGKKVPRQLTNISGIFGVLKGFINILRVYTTQEHREEVSSAARELLGETPYSLEISY
nr:HD domain-containing protein [Candidatus Bathyarchaeota archaeon]NIU80997.1 HD domain-containing protein [Candidatus Bathyarchaeota archaeon]NIV68403.1 HD domain-containing protein [Candidatus Bathyarchaeota archaeon]NIW34263.1 HD domain-containing protein [Candidatus Bathyarchaeota archaeon]